MKKVELLAPAGNMECLYAAIEAGCDAVYLSGKLYGARAFAGNFTNDEIKEAIKICHLYGVKVYVTINTIVYENEVDNFIKYVRFLHENNVDAVLIQDLGMMDLVRKKFPNLTVHASTQMHVHNYEGALFAKEQGIKRVVMARETQLDLVKKINKELNIETEVFIHGALCISYSGECLASTLIGPRSANRGTCAGICRKKYNLYDENNNKLNEDNYLLSAKELCTLNDLKEIILSGVTSLKIEGRMKRPEYVYLVVSAYRKVIDNYYETGDVKIDEKDIINLKKMYNRSFTKGFMLGEANDAFTYSKRPNHMGIKVGKVVSKTNDKLSILLEDTINIHDAIRILDAKEDKGIVINKMFVNNESVLSASVGDMITIKYDGYVEKGADVLLTTDYNLVNDISKRLKSLKRKVLIDVGVVIKKDREVILTANDGTNKVTIKSDFVVDRSINAPLTKESVIKQLSKTNDTVYEIKNINIVMDDDAFIQVKKLNELRRTLLYKLNERRLYKIDFKEKEYEAEVPDFDKCKRVSVLTNNPEKYSAYDVIYTDNKDLLKDNIVYKLPRVIYNYPKYDKKVLIGEVGSLTKYKTFDTDFSFNVVNSYTAAFLHNMGADIITLSYELNFKQTKDLVDAYHNRYKKHPNLCVITSSYPEAMVCKFDLNKKYKVPKSYLEDEFKNRYKVISSRDYMTIYNYKKVVIDNKEDYYDIGINYLRENKEDF